MPCSAWFWGLSSSGVTANNRARPVEGVVNPLALVGSGPRPDDGAGSGGLFGWDEYWARFAEAEIQALARLADLIGYDPRRVGGGFIFSGTGISPGPAPTRSGTT
jgi:hypothetical protein